LEIKNFNKKYLEQNIIDQILLLKIVNLEQVPLWVFLLIS